MDFDKIIDEVAQEFLNPDSKHDQPKENFLEACRSEKNNPLWEQNEGLQDSKKSEENLEDLPMRELLKLKPRTEDIKQEIYFRFKHDIELFVNDFLTRSVDVNKDKGMQKCYLETWQACATEIGHLYFNKYKYLRKPRQDGEVKRGEVRGQEFEDELLPIGIEVYEDFCNLYRKQFFIYDCCKFLGMNMDSMYKLSEMRTDLLKKAHTKQEGSMRTALASGRSNVTAMAILLNHDYDYTRTTQVIHTTGSDKLNAENLPTLEAKPQDIDSGRHSSMITDSGDNM